MQSVVVRSTAAVRRGFRFRACRVEHAPDEHRESMLENVRLNREIMEA